MHNNSENKPTRLLIVDDSRLIRRVISNIFEPLDDIEVVGEACNGKEALDLIPHLNPDVVTMDIEMPVMDGLTALKHIMVLCPKPTVMLSTLTRNGAKTTFDALKLGAIDFIHKPNRLNKLTVQDQQKHIIHTITYAARVQIDAVRYIRPQPVPVAKTGDWDINMYDCFVVIGAAEGGYRDILNIVPHLSAQYPVAFMVMLYTSSEVADNFARYLDDCSAIRVKRVKDGEVVRGGICYLISEDEYVTVHEKKQEHIVNINPSPFPSRRGAINMLMFTVAELMGERAVGVILSGLGDDGAEGLEEIIRMGGTCYLQNPQNCLYKEMPEAVLEICTPDFIMLSDREIAAKINDLYINGKFRYAPPYI
ncbi:chemotaxis protein CheB [Desulfococcaceae bacterium HSG9]|nr:chemotaxis protein CheB [Desulfococcaceae bacterium HSG9]